MIEKKRGLHYSISFLITFSIVTWSKVSLLDEPGDVIRLKFEVPHYEIGSRIIDGTLYTSIIEPSEPPTFEKGFPEVPYYTQSVLIDNQSSVDVELIHIKYKEMKIHTLIPSRGQIKRSQNPDTVPYACGEIYTQNCWYPEKNVTITKPFIFRDVRGVTVIFNPFQFNAALGILRVAEEIVVAITTTGITNRNSISEPEITSSAFSNIYEETFINYTTQQYESHIPDGDRMIIIAAEKYKDKLNEFVEWKNRKGIKTTVHSYLSETDSGTNGVQNFINKKYDEEKITYVLLVGNGKDIPGNGDLKDRDPPYSLVTDDMYPEVFVGRFCIDNDEQLQTIIAKSISYEKEPDIEGTWYGNALLNGSRHQQFSHQADWKWMMEFADSLKKGGYKNTYIYSEEGSGDLPAGTAETTSAAINKGISWFTYMGHGTPSTHKAPFFNTSDILKLSNHGKYGVCLSVACSNGAFNTEKMECMGQAWTVAGSPTQGKGGIVFLGSSIEPDWVPPQYGAQSMMKIIAQKDNFLSVGNIVYNGHAIFLSKYNGDRGETFAAWNYFGDPSIHLRFAPPTPLEVDHPMILNRGKHEFEVKAPDNTIVCVYGKSQNIWQTEKVSGGKAMFTIEVTSSTDSIYVTGNGKNTIPYFGVINGSVTGIVDNSILNTKTRAHILYNKVINTVLFTFPEKYSTVSISIYGVNGRLVYSKKLISSTIDTFNWNFITTKGAKLAKGIYFVSMTVHTEANVISNLHNTLIYGR